MKFGTISLVAGTEACNARCDFCIAKMTCPLEKSVKNTYSNLRTACWAAEKSGATSALITSKGEPTLFPDIVGMYVKSAKRYFPFIELQTNGLLFLKDEELWKHILIQWRLRGLNLIALSIVHYADAYNKVIYCDDNAEHRFSYPPLVETVRFLQELSFSVRLNCIGCKGYIDDADELQRLLNFAEVNRFNGKHIQVTWRPVKVPNHDRNPKVSERASELYPGDDNIKEIRHWAHYGKGNTFIPPKLPHGAEIFDMGGQNLCLSNCMTRGEGEGHIVRQVIYIDNSIRYDWEYPGAVLL